MENEFPQKRSGHKHMESNVKKSVTELESVVIRFAGDSGDGMQLTGTQFTNSSAIAGNDISTFPDFPAEIRAPQGTLPGVSGFQLCFGSNQILTPGDTPDVLVAMNPAAFKVNISELKNGGIVIANTNTFTPQNLKKAGYTSDPLEDKAFSQKFKIIKIKITDLTLEVLKDNPLKTSEKTLSKNFFALGVTYWLYNRDMDYTLGWIKRKFAKKTDVIDANSRALKAGYYFAETSELMPTHFHVSPVTTMEPGVYRKISGNEALSFGIITFAKTSNIEVVYASYPITPATDILAYLSSNKHFGIKTLQAEDEIAAIGMALGASFAGNLGITATSGPGMCLKAEMMGLAVITELPLIVINVQRGGPSTGLPTKTEQADLLQVLFGRNGESPVPILAARSPSDCFETFIDCASIAFKYNTPVVMLSDGYIANGTEPWKIPAIDDLPSSHITYADKNVEYVPYQRDPHTLARRLAIPGTPGQEHRIGGLEKNETGGVSYDPENHEKMVCLRAGKVAGIARDFKPTEINGSDHGKILVIGWGGTYGAITTAVNRLQKQGHAVSSLHLRYLNPLPLDLHQIIKNFEKVLIPEINLGQLTMLIRAKYLIDAECFSKVQGRPFAIQEIETKIRTYL